jgi:hypothetical protein
MLKKIAFFLFVFSMFGIKAQSIVLKGTVKDSLQNPLTYANVIVKPENSTIDLSFAITNEQGRYKLELIKNETYTIEVSFLGFTTQSLKFKSLESTTKDFILNQASQQLNEVVIIQQLPVEVKEDTITYRTKAFVTGQERKLKAVLNKLPGVEVDKDGLVTVQGKKVTHMLVEGKKFFGGNSKLAVENIPADAVDKVEVIDNYNEIAMLKGLEETDDMAMNIKLKKEKNKFAFGDIEAGKGNEDYYLAHTGLFYYSPKTTINFIGDVNNSGNDFFSLKDFYRFEGGIDKISKTTGSMYNTSTNNYSAFLNLNDVTKSISKFTALNLSAPISKTTEVSGYVLFSNLETTSLTKRFTQYLFEDNAYTEQLDKEAQNNSKLAIAKIGFKHAPNLKSEWYFNSHLKYNNVAGASANNSVIDYDETIFKLNTGVEGLLFKQNIEWYKKHVKKHTTSFIVNYKFENNSPESHWFTGNYFNADSTPKEEDYNIFQQIKSTSNIIDINFKHFWLLNSKSQLQTTAGNYFYNDKYATNLLPDFVDSPINDLDFENNLNYTLNDVYLGTHYKFKQGKFLLEAGGYLHNYDWKIVQAENTHNNKYSFLPNFIAKYSFYKSEILSFTYSLKNQFLNTPQFTDNYTLLNYNTAFRGNSSLAYINYHSARLWYTKFNLYKNIILSGSVGFNKKKEVINNEITVIETTKFLHPILLKQPDINWNFNGDLYKRYGKFKFRFTGRFDISEYSQLINSDLTKNNNFNQYYKTSIETVFKKAPNVRVGYNLKLSSYKTATTTSNYTIKEPFLELEYLFLKSFTFKADYYKNTFENKTLFQKDSYSLANASLFYQKEDSAWGFELSGENLFNIKYKLNNNVNDYLISDTKTYILPRVYMFTISYKL